MNKKKIYIVFYISLILIIVLILYLLREKPYTITYNIDNYNIEEEYIKEIHSYKYSLVYEGKTFENIIPHKFIHGKKHITNVNVYEKEDIKCIYMKNKKMATYPSCYKEEDSITYLSIPNYDKPKYNVDGKSYNLININSFTDKTILLWEHKGYSYLNTKKQMTIDLFDEQTYKDEYSFKINNYVLIPDYSQKYMFDKFYVIDMTSGLSYTFPLKEKINYDFYYLGTYKNIGYVVDKKDRKEYTLNPKKKTQELISKNGQGKLYTGTMEEISMVKLSSNNYKFYTPSIASFIIEDDKLYMNIYKSNIKTKVSEEDIDRIIYEDGLDVYYVSKNKLYRYNPYYGETLILTYSELEFNDGITIYIF